MCSVYFLSMPHCSPVSFLELHLHHVPWRTFFKPHLLLFSLSLVPLFISAFFFPCHKIMLFLVDSGGAWKHLQGMIKPKAWRGYLQEVEQWQCPTAPPFSLSDGRSMLRQGRAMIHISNTLNLPSMHSQSFTLITWSPTVNSRQGTFCKDKTKLKLKPVLSQRQHDWGPLFETIGCFCSYAEQMVSRHQCRRLSGTAAMRFPLRCDCSPFRMGRVTGRTWHLLSNSFIHLTVFNQAKSEQLWQRK